MFCTKTIDGKGKDWLETIDLKMVGLNPRPEVNNVLQGLYNHKFLRLL